MMGHVLGGAITDRLTAGTVDADPLAARTEVDDTPKMEFIINGHGRGLGRGATRARSADFEFPEE